MLWWRASNSGYTTSLEEAGRYTAEAVTSDPSYYNNGESTAAVPVEMVECEAFRVVFSSSVRYEKFKSAANGFPGDGEMREVSRCK